MKNEPLYFKDDIKATCPKCGDSDFHRAYLNSEILFCDKCNNEFGVTLFASNVEFKAS